jgi:hypothetical protein
VLTKLFCVAELIVESNHIGSFNINLELATMKNNLEERTQNTLRGALFAMGAEVSEEHGFDWSLESPIGKLDWIIEDYTDGYVVTCKVPYAETDQLASLAFTPALVEIATAMFSAAFREYVSLSRRAAQPDAN